MMSRSSSTYQPLATVSTAEAVTPAIPRRQNFSGTATTVRIQGIVLDNDDAEEDDPMSHEMTSIAIISQHPLRPAVTSTIVSSSGHHDGPRGGGGPVDVELKLSSIERRRACAASGGGKESSCHWSNFHFVMCIGVIGFLVFWFILLCRMYLPVEYQFWAKPKP